MFEHGFPEHWSTLKKLVWLVGTGVIGGASAVWKTVTGTLIHITDALASPMQKCEVTLEPIQDLHGQDAPYPAGGGKNKLKNLLTTQTISEVTFTVYDDGSVNVNGTASEAIVFSLNDDLGNYLTNGTQYILNGSPTNSDTTKWKLRVYNNSHDYIDVGNGISFNFVSGSPLIAQKCDIVVYSGTTMSNVLIKPMIRLSSVADGTFAPYENICPITGWTGCNIYRSGADTSNPTTYPISWQTEAGTVYGCNVTVDEDGSTSLVKTYDWDVFLPSGWSWGWSYYSPGGYFRSGKFNSIKAGTNGNVTTARCNMLKPTEPNNIVDLSINISTDRRVVIKDISLNGDVNALETKYADAIIVYEKSSPSTYQLSDIEPITTLLGENNIWADAGDLEITYKAQA